MKLLLTALLAISLIGCKSIPVNHTEKEISTDTKTKLIAKEFFYEYVPDNEMVLLFDQCDKSNVSLGYQAEVRQHSTGNKAQGCWRRLIQTKDGLPIEWIFIDIDLGDKKKADFQFRAKQFSPRF